MKEKYAIWSNEHEAWWGSKQCGYTHDFNKCGRYDLEEAKEICDSANKWIKNNEIPDEIMIRVK